MAIASQQPHSPLSAGLRVQTDLQPQKPKTDPQKPNADPMVITTHSETAELHLRQASSTASLPARSASVKSALSAAQYTGGSLSPASALSSPGLGPFAEMTPLPSPMTSVVSPGLWNSMAETEDTSPPSSLNNPIARSCALPAESSPSARTSPKKRRAYHGLISAQSGARIQDKQISDANTASHARNRSLSEYVPGAIQVPRVRNIVVSGSKTPTTAERHSPPDPPMHREEYLAVQRGLALPALRPPTPPRSNRGVTDSSDLESPPISPGLQREHIPVSYEARDIRNGKSRRWTAIRPLGKGTFSTVMLATREDLVNGDFANAEQQLNPKSLVAVKICEHGPAGGADEKKIETSLKRELDILKSISHPSLVHLKAVNILDKRAYLVLNYSAGGDLFELASSKLDLLVPSLIRRIFAELVTAVRYLHSQYIVHRDIKLENVLVNLPTASLPTIADWQTYTSPVVTLTDLGLGRWIPRPPESPLLDTRCGSEDYAAPELLMGQEYDGRATDAWALGVLLYAIMEGRLPFDPVPGSRRRQSPTSHRIARCEWSWVKWADVDGEWDPVKGKELEGARECVEGLLKRVRSRCALEKVEELDWVMQGIQVEGGLKRFEDEDE
ncbi:hypothetical protein MMC24_000766 [Lignoscripta atroalba]|nr:hypothetical protein [Lignoscripta atroalba]